MFRKSCYKFWSWLLFLKRWKMKTVSSAVHTVYSLFNQIFHMYVDWWLTRSCSAFVFNYELRIRIYYIVFHCSKLFVLNLPMVSTCVYISLSIVLTFYKMIFFFSRDYFDTIMLTFGFLENRIVLFELFFIFYFFLLEKLWMFELQSYCSRLKPHVSKNKGISSGVAEG